MSSLLLSFLLACAAFGALPTLLTFGLAWRHRAAWVDWRGPGAAPADDYRGAALPWPRRGVPRGLAAVAWASFALGQMAVPGLAWGLYGVMFMGLGLISIPGLVVAVRCGLSGWHLLRRDARAAAFAEGTGRWSQGLNVLILALVMGALVIALVTDEMRFVPLAVGTGLYALVSLVHAWSLKIGRAHV